LIAGLPLCAAAGAPGVPFTSKTPTHRAETAAESEDPAPPESSTAVEVKKEPAAQAPEAVKVEKKAEVPAPTQAAAEPAADSGTLDIKGEKDTWLSLGGTGAMVSGDAATFRQRAQVPRGFSGGIEDFHTEGEAAKNTIITLDGRGIFDNHDYLLKLNMTNSDIGYIDTGYRAFRTWYENTGGFFPPNGAFFDLYGDDEFAIDRSSVWFEAGLTVPDAPEFIFRYEHDARQGTKDSTIWGDSTLTGRAKNIARGSRGFVPTYWVMDENSDTFSLEFKHKVGDTKFGAGARYEYYSQDDGRYMHRRPQEAQDRRVTQKEIIDSDLFNIRGWQQTELDEKSSFSTAYSFTTMDTNLGGSRIYGTTFDAPYVPRFSNRQQRDEGFFSLGGGANVKDHTATLSYVTLPFEDTKLILSLRIQNEKVDALSSFEETNVGPPAALNPILVPINTVGNEESLNVSESAELRYDAIRDWLLYLSALWEQTEGNFEGRLIESDTGLNDIFWNQDICRYSQKYAAGANWYPLKEVSVAMQYYFRDRSTAYAYPQDSTPNGPFIGDRYPDFLVYQADDTHDANLRVSVRPCNVVTLVSRVDLQLIEMYSQGANLERIRSADIQNYIVSQTATWNATPRLYLQGNVTWTWSQTDTPADDVTGAAQDLVFDSYSNYWYGNFTTGYVLTQDADLQAGYSYYRSYPFFDNSGQSMPYGVDEESHEVTVGLLWRICENVRWNIKYGFMNNKDAVFGQHNNFTAHLAYSSVDMAF